MGLGKYLQKRKFEHTPEPAGKTQPRKNGKLRFVVQEHHASTLHYDFRLELDGVLKSWAVPKGPSMDPHEHHLAIQTEDHPYEYRKFEGVIPEGNYGAGNVIIWDEGWYEPRADDSVDDQKTLRAELKKGHLTFVVHGTKLQGEFALIKMQNAKENNAWLLVKKGDDYASDKDVIKQDESVKSHKKVDDMGAADKLPTLDDAPKKTMPKRVTPMLCTLVDEPFDRADWLFEVKWDGYRAIGSKHKDAVELYSRNGLNFADKYPPAIEALHGLKHDVVVDGEIVVVDQKGMPRFEWLQEWTKNPQGELQYYLFDILWLDGQDVTGLPLRERKKLLKTIVPSKGLLKYSDDVEQHGTKLYKIMQKRGLEGMVAKRADSPYREGERGSDWLKIKTHQRQEVVIGGYTEPRGSRQYLGSLLVGVYQHGQLIYCGHSGGGIPDDARKSLRDQLAKLERKDSPFSETPKPNAPVHWVQPKLVAEMSFAEWTSEGMMRHPAFEGLRPDKKPTAVVREKAVSPTLTQKKPAKGALPFELTHLDKVFFPKTGYTKGDMIEYYQSVAPYILPYLRDRPCSLNRMPNGIGGESFYQKNNEHLPDWVPHADIFSDSNNANLRWIVGGELNTLLYMVQLGCVEINPWNSRVDHLEKPDWIVIDLDPDGARFSTVVTIARTVHEVCEEWHIPAYPKTSGKTGIHIYIPLAAKYTYEQGRNLAHLIVLEVNKRQPKNTSVERNPAKRKGKLYLDFLQNRPGQTLAAPYSLRPTPTANVSMPLHWDEVTPKLLPSDFTIKNAAARLKRVGDLWRPTLQRGIDLPVILKRMEQNLDASSKK